MKFNKLMILSAAVSLSGMAHAAVDIKDSELDKAKKAVHAAAYNSSATVLGGYKLEPAMQVVPSAIASSELVVAEKGSMSIVTSNTATDVIGVGSVVRSNLTNQLTTLTGHVNVLLKKGVSASDLAALSGMEVISVFPGTDIAILKIVEGNDLVEAFNSIKQSGLTIESKVEVTDTIYEAQ